MTHLILTIFLGWAGYARFRKGQTGLGVLWLFTGGAFFIGWIIDIVQAYQEMNTNNKVTINQTVNPATKINTASLGVAREMHTKVVGVTFGNDDGTSRQQIISQCKAGQSVVFKPTPTAEFPEAIGVFTENGKQLGNVNAELAHDLINRYFENPMKVTIADITGGKDGKNYGCNIHLIIYNKS